MASKQSGPGLLIPFALFALLSAAVVFVVAKNKQEKAEAPVAEPEEVKSPFEDLPEETGRVRDSSSSRSSSTKDYSTVEQMPDLSGNPLATDPVWLAATEKGARADEFFDEALTAREDSDYSGFSEKGRAALDLYVEILESTAEYEQQVAAEHGDTNVDVRGLGRARTFWEDRRATLRKLVR